MNVELLHKEAQLKYPIGTIFICPYNHEKFEVQDNNGCWVVLPNDDNNIDGGFDCGYLRYKDVWAEILSLPTPKITQQQKQTILNLIKEI